MFGTQMALGSIGAQAVKQSVVLANAQILGAKIFNEKKIKWTQQKIELNTVI